MISKIRKNIILTVAVLSIVMILANILQAHTNSFVPLETKEHSPDNIDERIYPAPDKGEELGNDRTNRIIVSPIHIDEDGGGDYTWAQAKDQPWCSGSGIE